MKRTVITTLALISLSFSALSQGSIVYYNRILNSVVAPIYGPEISNPAVVKTGNTLSGTPSGTQVYSGALLSGDGYTVSLWAGPANTPESALMLVPGSVTGFRTGVFAGAIDHAGSSIVIPGVGAGSSAALQLRVYDNQGGSITSWAQAILEEAAFGASPVFNSAPLGGPVPQPNLVGLQSFNIHLIHVIPEPSIYLLAGLSATVIFIFRRRG